MNNQRQFLQQSFNLTNFSSIVAMYFYSLGSMLLGYSVYLIYTLNSVDSPTSWVGESLFWGVIVFFLSIFILFLPVEFFNNAIPLGLTFFFGGDLLSTMAHCN